MDWGTWHLTKGADPAAAIAGGELHLDLSGEKLRGHFMLIRRDRDSSGKEQWLLFHKKDEFAVSGWDPEDHPRSVKTGRTNDEVKAAPGAVWHSNQPARQSWDPPTAEELATLDALEVGGSWQLQGRELRLTNLGKVLFPPRDGGAPVTKRDLVRYHALMAPYMLPYLYDRPVNAHRHPDGIDRPGFWHKEVPSHAPEWLRQWHNDVPTRVRRSATP